MMRLTLIVFAWMGAVVGAHGCHDSRSGILGSPARNVTLFSCKVCLADDAARCATHTSDCGDSSERMDSETAARDALCDTLSPADLARRPTPTGFKPSPWLENACYAWPVDAFTSSCSSFTKTCDGVPVH
jgi:hypothetical protein